MEIKISPKVAKKIICDTCDYTCSKESDFNKHLMTSKHIKNENGNEKEIEVNKIISNFNCEKCKKNYKTNSGLWKHNKICKTEIENENIVVLDSSNNNIINLLIKENSDFKHIIMDLVKSNTNLQKQMIDVCQKIKPAATTINNTTTTNTTNNNNNNKTFNLQFFLNEQCKDAMNIKDFVQSIQIEMSDLERIGKEGYVEGISRIILEKLRNTDIYKRPLHCSDAKRETMYIKEDNVWNKDESLTNEKLIRFIKDVDNKNYDFLLAYAQEYPEVYQHDSKRNTPYLHMVLQSTRDAERVNKVIKRIIKEVVINKDNNI